MQIGSHYIIGNFESTVLFPKCSTFPSSLLILANHFARIIDADSYV